MSTCELSNLHLHTCTLTHTCMHTHTLYNRNKIPANDYAVLAVALQYVKRKDLPVSPSHSELCYISACVDYTQKSEVSLLAENISMKVATVKTVSHKSLASPSLLCHTLFLSLSLSISEDLGHKEGTLDIGYSMPFLRYYLYLSFFGCRLQCYIHIASAVYTSPLLYAHRLCCMHRARCEE